MRFRNLLRRPDKAIKGVILTCLLTALIKGLAASVLEGRPVNWLMSAVLGVSILLLYFSIAKKPSNASAKPAPAATVFTDPGVFNYGPEGFAVPTTTGLRQIAWCDIQALFGYKIDLYTIDQIQLDVFIESQSSLCLTEELPGWYPFLRRLEKQFPSVPTHWEIAIASPAFATNLTLLYEISNLNLAQATPIYYRPNK